MNAEGGEEVFEAQKRWTGTGSHELEQRPTPTLIQLVRLRMKREWGWWRKVIRKVEEGDQGGWRKVMGKVVAERVRGEGCERGGRGGEGRWKGEVKR